MHVHNSPNKAPLPLLSSLQHSSTLFTGRDEYLQKLRDYFGSGIGGERKSFLLYGLGGIGKTQMCLKFIEENADL
jgi:Cdc6-like AAA superfamily ATPase